MTSGKVEGREWGGREQSVECRVEKVASEGKVEACDISKIYVRVRLLSEYGALAARGSYRKRFTGEQW